METRESASFGTWANECDLLTCIDCGGAIEPASADALICNACRRVFSIHNGILDVQPQLEGNNRIAADYYNGPLWPKFRFWERFAC